MPTQFLSVRNFKIRKKGKPNESAGTSTFGRKKEGFTGKYFQNHQGKKKGRQRNEITKLNVLILVFKGKIKTPCYLFIIVKMFFLLVLFFFLFWNKFLTEKTVVVFIWTIGACIMSDMKRLFYVWFLGAKECRGLRGDEFVRPIVRYVHFRVISLSAEPLNGYPTSPCTAHQAFNSNGP